MSNVRRRLRGMPRHGGSRRILVLWNGCLDFTRSRKAVWRQAAFGKHCEWMVNEIYRLSAWIVSMFSAGPWTVKCRSRAASKAERTSWLTAATRFGRVAPFRSSTWPCWKKVSNILFQDPRNHFVCNETHMKWLCCRRIVRSRRFLAFPSTSSPRVHLSLLPTSARWSHRQTGKVRL